MTYHYRKKQQYCDSAAARRPQPTPEQKKERLKRKYLEICEDYGIDEKGALGLATELYNNHVGIIWALCGKPTQTDLLFQ